MVSHVRPSPAERSAASGTCGRKLHHFGNMEGPLMKDFQEKGDYPLMLHLYPWRGQHSASTSAVSHTHTHTHPLPFMERVVPIFPDDKHHLSDALQTSWRQHKQKSIHQPRSAPAHPGNDECVSVGCCSFAKSEPVFFFFSPTAKSQIFHRLKNCDMVAD